MTVPFRGLPPTEAETLVRRFVNGVHRQANVAPIQFANSAGAFPGVALMSQAFPLVLDANMIRGELIRVASTGRTVLISAANTGVFRLFVAQHVVDEVWEHHATWARRRGIDPNGVKHAWEDELLPLLRCVDIPDGWTTAEEWSRLATLARPAPAGDPDDVPTATLALLLGAPILSRDRKVLEAVYGVDFDQTRHKQWLAALMAGGDLGPLGQYLHLSMNMLTLLGRGAIGALRATGGRWPSPILSSAILGTGALALALTPAEKLRDLGSRIGGVLEVGLTGLLGLGAAHRRAEEQFETLAAPFPSDDDILNELTAGAAVGRLCFRELSRAPESQLSTSQLHHRLASLYVIPGGEASVGRALRRWPCFLDVGEDEHQLGRAVVFASSFDEAAEGTRP